jgi:hypothetical protein
VASSGSAAVSGSVVVLIPPLRTRAVLACSGFDFAESSPNELGIGGSSVEGNVTSPLTGSTETSTMTNTSGDPRYFLARPRHAVGFVTDVAVVVETPSGRMNCDQADAVLVRLLRRAAEPRNSARTRLRSPVRP